MNVLGLHKDPWHSSGAAIIREHRGRLQLVNVAEERLNREKDSRRFPDLSVAACMDELGVRSVDEIDLIAMDYIVSHRPSPYMLLVPAVVESKRQVIPAVTHVDGTGRLQTVSKDSNPHLYSIIDRFREATGVPVLLNTSFNVANEPIVETPEDAIRCFLGTGIDAQLIGDRLLIKDDPPG